MTCRAARLSTLSRDAALSRDAPRSAMPTADTTLSPHEPDGPVDLSAHAPLPASAQHEPEPARSA